MLDRPIKRPLYAQEMTKALRLAGITSKAAAERLGTSAPLLSMFMNGRRIPSEEAALQISVEFFSNPHTRERFLFLVELARRVSFTPRTEAELRLYVEFEEKLLANFEFENGGQKSEQMASLA